MNLNVLLLLVAVGLVKGSRAPRVDDSREAVLTFLGIDSTNLQINDLPTFLNAPLPPMGIHNLSAQDISFVIEEYLRQSFFEKASITFNPKSYLEQATLIFISRSALISQKELVIKHPAYLQKFLPRLYHISSISARECVRILAEIEDETFPDMLQWFWAESREEEAMDALVTEWRKLSGPIDPNEPAVKSRELLFKRTSRLQSPVNQLLWRIRMEEIPLKHFAFKQISSPVSTNSSLLAQSNNLGLVSLCKGDNEIYLVKSKDLLRGFESGSFEVEELSLAHIQCPQAVSCLSFSQQNDLIVGCGTAVHFKSIGKILNDPSAPWTSDWTLLLETKGKVKKITTSSSYGSIVVDESEEQIATSSLSHCSWSGVVDVAWSPSESSFCLLKAEGTIEVYNSCDSLFIASFTLETEGAFAVNWLSEDAICCSSFGKEQKLEHFFVSVHSSFAQTCAQDFTFVLPEEEEQNALRMHCTLLPQWKGSNEEWDSLLLASSSRSSEISLFLASKPPSIGFIFEEDDRAVLPNDENEMETFPLSTALDCTIEEPFKVGEESICAPVVWILTSVGNLLCYRLYKNDSSSCPFMELGAEMKLQLVIEAGKVVAEEPQTFLAAVKQSKELFGLEEANTFNQKPIESNKNNEKEQFLDLSTQKEPELHNVFEANNSSKPNEHESPLSQKIAASTIASQPVTQLPNSSFESNITVQPEPQPPTAEERLSELKSSISKIISTKSPAEAFPLLFTTSTCGFSAQVEDLHSRVKLLWNIRDNFTSTYPNDILQFIATISSAETAMKSILLYLSDIKQSSEHLAKRLGKKTKSKSTFGFADDCAEVQKAEVMKLDELFSQINLAPKLLKDELVMALSGISIGKKQNVPSATNIAGFKPLSQTENVKSFSSAKSGSFVPSADLKTPKLNVLGSSKPVDVESKVGKGPSSSFVIDSKSSAAFNFTQSAMTNLKPAVQSQSPIESKPVFESKPAAETKPAVQSVLNAEAKPAVQSVFSVEAKPAAQSAFNVEAKPAFEFKPTTESKPTFEIKSAFQSTPPAEATSAFEFQSESKTTNFNAQPSSQFNFQPASQTEEKQKNPFESQPPAPTTQQPVSASSFNSQPTPNLFGQSNSTQAAPSVFGQASSSVFGQPSAFGQTSTFGQSGPFSSQPAMNLFSQSSSQPTSAPPAQPAFGATSALLPPNPTLYNSPVKPAPTFGGFGAVSSFNSSSNSPFKASPSISNQPAAGFGGAFGSSLQKEASPFASMVENNAASLGNNNNKDSSTPSQQPPNLPNSFSNFRF